jgi:hypothetical protein
MRRLGLLVWIAAACDGNVYIEVRTTNVTADRVELFISNDPCVLIDMEGSKTGCTGMQPQGFSTPIGSEGAVFFRDALDENIVAVDSSGSAFFELLAGPETLRMVVAVGTSGADGAKTITGVAIMEDTIDLTKSPIRYLAELEPVEPLTEAGPRRQAPAAAIAWPETSRQIRCLGVESYANERGPVFIVDPGDADCDGVAQPECNPLAYLGFGVNTSSHCVVQSETITGNSGTPCVLGHQVECSEGASPPPCIETGRGLGETFTTCVPGALCEASCIPGDEGCHGDKLAGIIAPRVRCTFRGELQQTGEMTPCEPSQPIALAPAPEFTFQCTAQPTFATLPLPFDAQNETLTLGMATIGFTSFDEQCSMELDWSGQVVDAGALRAGVVEVAIKTAAGELRHLMLPIVVEIVAGCAEAGECGFETGADSMLSCTE